MSTRAFEIRGWHVLATILAFFATIIAVNVTFAIYAVRSFPGEDVRRSYLQGLNYNDTLIARRAQEALGWTASAELRGQSGGAILEVVLSTRETARIDDADLTGELEWPTDSRFDRALTFEPQGDGRYLARLGTLTPGRWRLRANAQRESDGLDFESELIWPSR